MLLYRGVSLNMHRVNEGKILSKSNIKSSEMQSGEFYTKNDGSTEYVFQCGVGECGDSEHNMSLMHSADTNFKTGYVSTTKNKSIAKSFALSRSSKGIIYTFDITKFQEYGVRISKTSNPYYPNEEEVKISTTGQEIPMEVVIRIEEVNK
jgi:hypothetical protein